MRVCLFFSGIVCAILMSETNNRTNTYRANNMTLTVKKSGDFDRNGDHGPSRLKYVVRSMDNGFEMEFFTNKDNLHKERLSDKAIRINYGSKDKATENTYLDISIEERRIKSFDIIDYFLIGSKVGVSALLDIIAEDP